MRKIIAVAALSLLGACGTGAQTRPAQPVSTAGGTLMSCGVTQSTGGEGGRITYNMNCKPVVGGDLAHITNIDGESFSVTYGGGQPAFGGGPVYILRYGSEPNEIHYGAPLDGNIGTVGR